MGFVGRQIYEVIVPVRTFTEAPFPFCLFLFENLSAGGIVLCVSSEWQREACNLLEMLFLKIMPEERYRVKIYLKISP